MKRGGRFPGSRLSCQHNGGQPSRINVLFAWAMDGHPMSRTCNNGVSTRGSTFASPKVHAPLNEQFVPVAIDQFNQIRQKDGEGRPWSKVAEQGPCDHKAETTWGFYFVTAAGELLAYGNSRGPKKVISLINKALKPELAPELLTLEGNDGRFLNRPLPSV